MKDENKRMRLKENLSVRKKEEQLIIVWSICGTKSLIDVSVKMIFLKCWMDFFFKFSAFM